MYRITLLVILIFFTSGNLEEIAFCEKSDLSSDFCVIPSTNDLGLCEEASLCDRATRSNRYRSLHVCKYNENGEISQICCPLGMKNSPGIRSRIRCQDVFIHMIPPLGVIYAAKAKPKEFPHMAAVGFGRRPNIEWLCGGTIIHSRFVLTAAHCSFRDGSNATWVRLGELIMSRTDEVVGTIDVPIIDIYIHPEYKFPSHYHDLALLKLQNFQSFEISSNIKPACLHTDESENIWKNNLQAIGWGVTEIAGDMSDHLLKVDMKLVNDSKCQSKYRASRKMATGIQNHQMCAENENGGDTCQGDSGGPLHYSMPETFKVLRHFVLIGVTAFGNSCGTFGVYTRVQPYLKWIEDTIWPICPSKENIVWD